jgi:hypothetical protein
MSWNRSRVRGEGGQIPSVPVALARGVSCPSSERGQAVACCLASETHGGGRAVIQTQRPARLWRAPGTRYQPFLWSARQGFHSACARPVVCAALAKRSPGSIRVPDLRAEKPADGYFPL